MTCFRRKKQKNKKNHFRNGFTLVEALIMLFIFALITLSFYYAIAVGSKYIQEAKNRLGAIALANEQMEIIRNLSYANVGVSGGIPAGSFPQDQDVTENTRAYHVHAFVEYIDDPLDGTYPTDTVPEDYKRVKLTVSWNDALGAQSISLVSLFGPPGMETVSGAGILSVNIIDNQNNGGSVPSATVQIVNNSVTPAINITTQTDSSGHLMLPGAVASTQGYQVTASKSGYETIATIDPSTVNYKPTDVNASVTPGIVNPTTISISKTVNLTINTSDFLGNAIGSISYSLIGGRIIGTNIQPPFSPIYNLVDNNDSTNASGIKSYNAVSPGSYAFALSSSVTNYQLIGIEPNPSPFIIPEGSTSTYQVELAAKNITSALITAVNSSTGALISGASVELSNASGYDVTETTDANGTAYFPNASGTFSPGNYNLKVTDSGFQDNNSQITINSNQLLTNKVQLVSQ